MALACQRFLGSDVLHKNYVFTSSVSLFVSVQSLVWIATDRFVAVDFAIKLGLVSSKIRTIAIVSTWVLAGVFLFSVARIFGTA